MINNDNEDDEKERGDNFIRWSNLLFLPFNPLFKSVVLVIVVIKTILGPIQSRFPIVYCWGTMDVPEWAFMKFLYLYCCDPIYGIDTLLHMLHRQVTDEAMKREFLPKSAFLLMLDIISLIPFYRILSEDVCPPNNLWPNLLAFSEFVIIYRVAEYFALITTHKFVWIALGCTTVAVISVNCVTCFWLLLTANGLCSNCVDHLYDWRVYVLHKLNETDQNYCTYVYASTIITSYVVNKQFDEIKPSTLLECVVISILMIAGYLLATFVVFPKMVAESLLKLRRIYQYYSQVHRLIEETQRRNPHSKTYLEVKEYYTLMWKERNGITWIPEVISELPRYLRTDIKLDLVWPVFYHSPTFRKTSAPYKRWLCEYIRMDYKLPGEKLFSGPESDSCLYYIKSGIVQLISLDDSVTPLISVASGTIFGDISFYIPYKRKTIVQCLTYCEIIYIKRGDILNSLHKYPQDRSMVIHQAMERIKHARTLNSCKQLVRGLDRTEDEGIAWIKKRWWEISEAVEKWKEKSYTKDAEKLTLPEEETAYHCAKYVGQLVLCSDIQLKIKSMFVNVQFPWIFVPDSIFGKIWRSVVFVTVFCVLLLYPPYITRHNIPKWFIFFQFVADFVYIMDICVALLTSVVRDENVTDSFAMVLFSRCKSINFVLDILSTVWIENLAIIIGLPKYYAVCQFNRLIKIHVLFTKWEVHRDPLYDILFKIVLIQFAFTYIVSYFIFMIDRSESRLTTSYFFGELFCKREESNGRCDFESVHPIFVVLAFCLELTFFEYLPNTLYDIYVAIILTYVAFILYLYCKSSLVASLYLRYRELCNYQYFVTNIKDHYEHHRIHPDLLKRLNRYLMCHWKYYYGMDVMHPNLLKNEPYDIYWKIHGQVAERVIKESKMFVSADPALIKELAYKGKFLILPKNSTIQLFGLMSNNVSWIVQGSVWCEHPNEKGELLKKTYSSGEMLTSIGVFFKSVSLRTLKADTECEILYIKIKDFTDIIKSYHDEWHLLQECVHEFSPAVDVLVQDYINKHKNYEKMIHDKTFHAKKIEKSETSSERADSKSNIPHEAITGYAWIDPSSGYIQYWMLLRAIVVVISISTTAIQGGSGATNRRVFKVIGGACDLIAAADILLKFCMGYYDQRGLLITSLRKSIPHYLSGGFIFDFLGCVPLIPITNLFMTNSINENDGMLIDTISKFAHLYMLTGYFNYIADRPNTNFTFIMIIKWQVVSVLALLGSSHYFVSKCIEFHWGDHGDLLNMSNSEHCWLPDYVPLDATPTVHQLHMVYGESLNLAQSGFMRFNLGQFQINRDHLGVGFTLLAVGLMFWCVMCYSLSLLILNYRRNTIFQHGVNQLWRFLKAERIDDALIIRAIAHFKYWWSRTKGINLQNLMNERIGAIFRQDLSYYFFQKTVKACASLLKGNEDLDKKLASAAVQIYFLPGETVVKEMQLNPWVYIVHRGKIIIKRNGHELAILTKGSIFGQLDGKLPRPVSISAISSECADLLQIPIADFQEIIGTKVRNNIAKNVQSKNDYIAVKKVIIENPYNTVKYLLRGQKAIQFPWMKNRKKPKSCKLYWYWLQVSYFINPVNSAIIVLISTTLSKEYTSIAFFTVNFLILDLLHLFFIVSEFFTTELTVKGGECVHNIIRWRLIRKWEFYVDVLSIIVPLISYDMSYRNYAIFRLLRLRLLYDYHKHFCRDFQSTMAPILLKFIIVFLLLHCMTCGWVFVACRDADFPLDIPSLPPEINATVDYTEWTTPDKRNGGCARITKLFTYNGYSTFGFLVPVYWTADYIVAMIYIIIIYTHMEEDIVVTLTLKQIYYKLLISFIIYPTETWILSVAVSAVYTKFRELYAYDYEVNVLMTSLRHSGLSSVLLKSVKEYTTQLWQRQRGNWLPELAQHAPHCLREDLLSALYIHHLDRAPLLRDLPAYFKRQVVARLKRVVVFPGKYIIREGDIFSFMCFIHEGEIEKLYTNKNGEKRQFSVLKSNGYFGLIPGLFPNTPFQFSYFSRTVVDLVFLRHKDWQDLLEGYPYIKESLYAAARQYRKENVL